MHACKSGHTNYIKEIGIIKKLSKPILDLILILVGVQLCLDLVLQANLLLLLPGCGISLVART